MKQEAGSRLRNMLFGQSMKRSKLSRAALGQQQVRQADGKHSTLDRASAVSHAARCGSRDGKRAGRPRRKPRPERRNFAETLYFAIESILADSVRRAGLIVEHGDLLFDKSTVTIPAEVGFAGKSLAIYSGHRSGAPGLNLQIYRTTRTAWTR